MNATDASALPQLLLVDDDERFVRACVRSWSTQCVVIPAHSGRHALKIAKSTRLDLALVDHRLGDYLGLCLITELKVRPRRPRNTDQRDDDISVSAHSMVRRWRER